MEEEAVIQERTLARKLWHFGGCIVMIVIYYLWRGMKHPFDGVNFLVAFAWLELALLGGIDLLRFYIPRYNEAVGRVFFYGSIMRPYEKRDFNASTYYILGATILITAYSFGWCQERTLVLSLLVLGIADPVAALAREAASRRKWWGQERVWGLLTFLAVSWLIMWLACRLMANPLSWRCLFGVSAIVALVETYAKHWVVLVRPLTSKIQTRITHPVIRWVTHLYPDDNLLVPVGVAILLGIMPALT